MQQCNSQAASIQCLLLVNNLHDTSSASKLAPWRHTAAPGKGLIKPDAEPPLEWHSDFPGKSVYFFVVWSFLLFGLFGFFFLLFGRGRVFIFAVWAGAQAPPKQQKKKHAPAPSERIFLLFGRVGVFIFLLFGRGACFFFAVWAGAVFFFLLFGRGRVLFFAVWAGACSFFLLFGPGACFFLLFGRGTGVHSLTRLPGSSLSDPTTKETEQQKKNTGSGFPCLASGSQTMHINSDEFA